MWATLDGLCGVAVVQVMLFHMGSNAMQNGWLCISILFSLSGIVVTGTVIQVLERTGTFDVLEFWTRRLTRVCPVLFLTLAVCALSRFVRHETEEELRVERDDLLMSVAFVSNYRWWYFEKSITPDMTPSIARHTWVLAVLEQYYLLWTLLFLICSKLFLRARPPTNTPVHEDEAESLIELAADNETGDELGLPSVDTSDPMRTFVLALCVMEVAILVLSTFSSRVTMEKIGVQAAYYSTWSRMGDVACGGIAVLLLRLHPELYKRCTRQKDIAPMPSGTRCVLEVGSFFALATAIFSPFTPTPLADLLPRYLLVLRIPFSGFFSLFAIAGVVQSSEALPQWAIFTRFLRSQAMVFLGTMASSIYILHWPVIFFFGTPGPEPAFDRAVPRNVAVAGGESRPEGLAHDAFLVWASLFGGYLAYATCEQPLWEAAKRWRPWRVVLGAVAAASLTAAVVSASHRSSPAEAAAGLIAAAAGLNGTGGPAYPLLPHESQAHTEHQLGPHPPPPPPAEAQTEHQQMPAEAQTEHQQMPAEAQTEHQQTPPEAQTEHQQTPAEAQTEHQQMPAEAQTEHQQMPAEAQTEHQQTPPEAQTEHQQTPPEAQTEHQQTPPEAQTEDQQMPAEAQTEDQRMPAESQTEHQQTPDVVLPTGNAVEGLKEGEEEPETDTRYTPIFFFSGFECISDVAMADIVDQYSAMPYRISCLDKLEGHDYLKYCMEVGEMSSVFDQLADATLESDGSIIIMCASLTYMSPCDHGDFMLGVRWVWLFNDAMCGEKPDNKHFRKGWAQRCPDLMDVHSLTIEGGLAEEGDRVPEKDGEETYTGRLGTDFLLLFRLLLAVEEEVPGAINAQTLRHVREGLAEREEHEQARQESIHSQVVAQWSDDLRVLFFGDSIADRVGGMCFELLAGVGQCVASKLAQYPFPRIDLENNAHRGQSVISQFIACDHKQLPPLFFNPQWPCDPKLSDLRREVLGGLAKAKPDVVVLHDGLWSQGIHVLSPAELREEAMTNFIKAIQNHGVKEVYWLTTSSVGNQLDHAVGELQAMHQFLHRFGCDDDEVEAGVPVTLVYWHLLTCPTFKERECPHKAHGFFDILPDNIHPSGPAGEWLSTQLLSVIINLIAMHQLDHPSWDEASGNPITECLLEQEPPDDDPPLDTLFKRYYVCPEPDS